MSKAIVVHYTGATRQSRSVTASLVADLVAEGHSVLVADISAFTTIHQDFPPGWVARLLGHKVFSRAFENALEKISATHLTLVPPPGTPERFPADIAEDCGIAIESELLTYFRRETLEPETSYISWLRKTLTHQAQATYTVLRDLFSAEKPDLVLVPNGRTSRQKVARKAAEQAHAIVNFYEMGRARNDSYYRGTTQPHDRVASQAEVTQLTKHLSDQEIIDLADTWFGERVSPTSGTNTFSTQWEKKTERAETKTGEKESAKNAVFFSSSADEFQAFGPMWNIDSWSSQFEAFDLMMSHFETMGVSLELRLHPNLMTKSRRYFTATIKNIKGLERKHPGLLVHWHNSPINSYDLIEQADYVVAERSTIALEANLVGKPVWINQAAQWDLVADIRQVLSPSDITPEVMSPWVVNSLPAKRFVAYWMIQEKPLTYSPKDWATWNPDNASWLMKIALLFVKNPWAHKVHLVSLEWARLRNSFFRG
jgi:hypothetical protein